MLKSLKIENFRCFKSFELKQLGRINLLVGANNSGKTSILEALFLLTSPYVNTALSSLMYERSEYFFDNKTSGETYELDFKHLFYGHEMELNSWFSISDQNDKQLIVSIIKNSENSELQIPRISLQLAMEGFYNLELPLSPKGGFDLGSINYMKPTGLQPYYGVDAEYVSSQSLDSNKMMELFDRIVLSPEEELVTEALKTIEPSIERIAPVKSYMNQSRSGFLIKFSNSSQRVPIGSMGDGMWRILGLALAIANAKDGFLLVDEIDTGLHFTAMTDMWKMLWKTAKRLNVQIFATTHSNDCWTSLADIANAENPSEDGIAIHRIEKGKSQSIVFTEDEIAIAAEEGIEVR
jgi:AAA15 family ATPase/GTPase